MNVGEAGQVEAMIGMPRQADLVTCIAAVAKGDQAALERLYAATGAKIYGVALRILRRTDLAEEVMQDTYLKAWRSAGEFSPQVATPTTWLVAIARARAIALARQHNDASAQAGPAAAAFGTEEPAPLARREVSDELRRLLGCLGSLDEERRRMVLLAYYNGWSREDLAERFDRPVNAIKASLRQSLIEIQECLGS